MTFSLLIESRKVMSNAKTQTLFFNENSNYRNDIDSSTLNSMKLIMIKECSTISYNTWMFMRKKERKVVVKEVIVCKLEFVLRKVIRKANVRHDIEGVFGDATQYLKAF